MVTEYPEALRRVLGVRYCTVCHLESDRYSAGLPQLLWSNEPFDAEEVQRQLLDRGWRDVSVRPGAAWRARVGRDPDGDRWVGLGRNHADRLNVARWPHRSEYLVLHHPQERGWRAIWVNTALYDKYDDPVPGVFGLTRHQAVLLSRAAGRELPTDAEVTAAVQVAVDEREAYAARRRRFAAARTARFRAEVTGLRAEAARLAALPPPRQHEDGEGGRERAVAAIPPVPVRLGESFPLVRFLVGLFRDRTADSPRPGAFQVRCNRLAVTVADGVTLDLALHVSMVGRSLHGRVVTPYLPAEADYVNDPAYADLRPPNQIMVSDDALPASPVHLVLKGRPVSAPPGRSTPLGVVLTFPGDLEYVTVPLTDGTSPFWYTARRYDPARGAVGPEVSLFVPDDINLLKPVRARLVPAP